MMLYTLNLGTLTYWSILPLYFPRHKNSAEFRLGQNLRLAHFPSSPRPFIHSPANSGHAVTGISVLRSP